MLIYTGKTEFSLKFKGNALAQRNARNHNVLYNFELHKIIFRYVLTNLFQLMSLGGTSRIFDWDASAACNPTNESADCKSDIWRFCPVCLESQEIELIAEINREQLNRNHFKRISPSMSHTCENESYLARFQRSYIQARCDLDKTWC